MRKLNASKFGASSQRGLTLIEVLVTAIIISTGLLGTAALHLTSLRNNFDALKRTQASILAADIADRMRANRTIALAQGYNPTTPSDTQALADVTEWRNLLAARLPNGTGTISLPAGGTLATISISWAERDSGTLVFSTMTGI